MLSSPIAGVWLRARHWASWPAVRMILPTWCEHLEEIFFKKFNSKGFARRWKPAALLLKMLMKPLSVVHVDSFHSDWLQLIKTGLISKPYVYINTTCTCHPCGILLISGNLICTDTQHSEWVGWCWAQSKTFPHSADADYDSCQQLLHTFWPG